MLVGTGNDGCLVVDLKYVSTQSGIEIEVAPVVVIEGKKLCFQRTVIKDRVGELTRKNARSRTGNELIEVHIIDVSTNRSLDFQMLVHVINSFRCKAEHVFR